MVFDVIMWHWLFPEAGSGWQERKTSEGSLQNDDMPGVSRAARLANLRRHRLQ
jgi:hypothetical protein